MILAFQKPYKQAHVPIPITERHDSINTVNTCLCALEKKKMEQELLPHNPDATRAVGIQFRKSSCFGTLQLFGTATINIIFA